MTAQIIDGKEIARQQRAGLSEKVNRLKKEHGLLPHLTVILVGNDPASKIYVRNKHKFAAETGLHTSEHLLPADTPEDVLHNLIEHLNDDPGVHGILVQLPLPDHLSAQKIIGLINPAKDVDGFHPVNAGLVASGVPGGIAPCTPAGCVRLLKSVEPDLTGMNAVVIGRSMIVGRPMGQLLVSESCTVTMTHSRTRNLKEICREADIIVSAVGMAEMVKKDWVKEGSILIDVGMNRMENPDGTTRLCGDMDFAGVSEVARAVTPVPGGVGPMTIAMLLDNTVDAACRQRGVILS